MLVATQKNLPVDVAVFSAAVADFKIKKSYKKIRLKNKRILDLKLEKNIDILKLCFKS